MTKARQKFEESLAIAQYCFTNSKETNKRIEKVLWRWFGNVAPIEKECVEDILKAVYYLED